MYIKVRINIKENQEEFYLNTQYTTKIPNQKNGISSS